MSIIAKRYFMGQRYDVAEASGTDIPLHPYSVGPYIYEVGSQKFNTSEPGLYSFLDTATLGFKRRVAWNGNSADRDGNIYNLMSAFSWNMVHGVGDESSDMFAIFNKSAVSKVRLRCGYQVQFLMWLLPQYCPSYQLRQIGMFSAELPGTGYDDSHVCIEVQIAGKWCLFDIDQKCYFTDVNGVHLNAVEILAAGGPSYCVRVMLSADLPYSYGSANNWDAGGYSDMALLTPEDRMAWLARIYQIPAVMDSGSYKCFLPSAYNDSARAAYMAPMATVMSESAFLAAYYP